MTWMDAAIVIIFLYFIVTAFSAGFIRETVGIAAAIAGVVLGGLLYDDVADRILGGLDNRTTADVIAFLGVLGGVVLAGQGLAMLIKPAVTVMQLGVFDQLLGGAFGAVKAFVIVEALLILFVTFPRYDLDKRINESEFASRMLEVSTPLLQVMPDHFQSQVDNFVDGTPSQSLPN